MLWNVFRTVLSLLREGSGGLEVATVGRAPSFRDLSVGEALAPAPWGAGEQRRGQISLADKSQKRADRKTRSEREAPGLLWQEGTAMNIVLIGYRCSGKTVVGKLLAHALSRFFVDTDAAIEEDAGASIESIVSERGWASYREMEKAFVQKLAGEENLVIATGGGIVLDKENVRLLQKGGWIVWLQGSPEVLRERMARDMQSGRQRPSLSGVDPLQEVERVLEERSGFYEQAGDYMVRTDHQTPEAVADMILGAIPQQAVQRG